MDFMIAPVILQRVYVVVPHATSSIMVSGIKVSDMTAQSSGDLDKFSQIANFC